MEYCKHQDLGKYLKAHGTLSEEYARTIAQQVLQGLFQMHENMIAHRDLKPGVSILQVALPITYH
jgi:serine/threonine protein kinase